MKKLTKKDKQEILRLRGLFANQILVKTSSSADGGLVAEIVNPHFFTEGETFAELLDMINDGVRTFLEIQKKYIPFMPEYMPPIEEARRYLNLPEFKKTSNLKLNLPKIREAAKS